MNTIKTLVLSGFVSVASLAGAVSVQADNKLDGLYLNAHLGSGNSSTDVRAVQRAADQAGMPISVESVDDNKSGYGLGVGWALAPNWSLELNYLDMKQVNVRFSATQMIDNLDDIHPEGGEGFTFSGLYRHALGERVHLRARLGVFDWDAEYDTITGLGGQLGKVDADGTDLYWGVGLDFKIIQPLSVTLEMQRFEFDNDARKYIRAGLEWRFIP